MSHQSFQEALNRGVLVFDGAMGTEIYRHHVFTNRCFDELCLSDPKLIRQIHAEYRDAGADVLTTNTFGANRAALAKFALAEKLPDILHAGARLGPRGGRRRRPADVRGRFDRSAAQPAAVRIAGRGDDRRAGAGTDGRRAPISSFSRRNRTGRPWNVARPRCDSLPDVPFVLSFVIAGGQRNGLGRIGRADVGPVAARRAHSRSPGA